MIIRRHWMAIFGNPTWLGFFVAAVLCEHFLPNLLRRHWGSIHPFLPGTVRLAAASHAATLLIGGLFLCAAMNVLAAAGWWYATRIVLDDAALVVRMPLASNSIPLQAIQDVQTARPWLGLAFNYGTLVIYSGNETENIDYVPDVENFARRLYRKNA